VDMRTQAALELLKDVRVYCEAFHCHDGVKDPPMPPRRLLPSQQQNISDRGRLQVTTHRTKENSANF